MTDSPVIVAKPVECLEALERADLLADEFFPGPKMADLSVESRKKMIFSSVVAESLMAETINAVDEQEDIAIYRALKELSEMEAEGIFEGGVFSRG